MVGAADRPGVSVQLELVSSSPLLLRLTCPGHPGGRRSVFELIILLNPGAASFLPSTTLHTTLSTSGNDFGTLER